MNVIGTQGFSGSPSGPTSSGELIYQQVKGRRSDLKFFFVIGLLATGAYWFLMGEFKGKTWNWPCRKAPDKGSAGFCRKWEI